MTERLIFRRFSVTTGIAAAAIALTLTACGGGDKGDESSTSSTTTTTTTDDDVTVGGHSGPRHRYRGTWNGRAWVPGAGPGGAHRRRAGRRCRSRTGRR